MSNAAETGGANLVNHEIPWTSSTNPIMPAPGGTLGTMSLELTMRYTGVLRKRTQRASVNQSDIFFSVPRKASTG